MKERISCSWEILHEGRAHPCPTGQERAWPHWAMPISLLSCLAGGPRRQKEPFNSRTLPAVTRQ